MGRFHVLPPAIAVTSYDDVVKTKALLGEPKVLAVDTETTGLSRPRDIAINLAISDGKNRFSIWPEAIPHFEGLLTDKDVKLIMHNANFDTWMLKNAGIDIYKDCPRDHYRVHDTMVMHALYRDDMSHGLKQVVKDFLGIEMVSFSETFNLKRNKKRTLQEILLDPENADVVANYASLDAFATFHVYRHLKRKLSLERIETAPMTLLDYFEKSEVPFTRVLYEMEKQGVLIDIEALLELAPKIEAKMAAIHKWLCKSTGNPYLNINSTPQLIQLFVISKGYTPLKYTDGGAPSIDAATLKAWADGGCEYAGKILEYRQLSKDLGTYITNLIPKVMSTGRLHAQFNQTGARTGRLSSSNPNLQNQPPFIREAYIPPEGHKFFAADYGQLEMRILAHMSRDPTLCNAINKGEDVHSSTAATMFGVPYADIMAARAKSDRIDEQVQAGQETEELTDRERTLLKNRKAAKTINFGLMYGQGANKLAATLKCDVNEARGYINKYFGAFPKITKYFEEAISGANENLYCTTLLGKRRHVFGLASCMRGSVAAAERQVKNSPIQGTASEITRDAMIRLYEDESIYQAGARMLIQVHDEVCFEVPTELAKDKDFNEHFASIMMHPFDFDLEVPLEIGAKFGDNWSQCK